MFALWHAELVEASTPLPFDRVIQDHQSPFPSPIFNFEFSILNYLDSHAHITLEPLSTEQPEVVKRASEQSVTRIINIGIDAEQHQKTISTIEQFNPVFGVLGFHPYEAASASERSLSLLKEQLTHPKILALGEIGLDYYHGPEDHELQKRAFRVQVELALELNLPVVIHSREAIDDILSLLAEYPEARVLMHSFTGNIEQAKRILSAGYLIGINGIATYNSAKDLQQAVTEVIPLERIVLETDCPYLAPQLVRGKTNEPQYIPMIAEHVAKLKQTDVETVAKFTTQNAERFFDLPHP